MGTQHLGAFPSLNNKIAIDSICYQIGDFFLKQFPVDYFKHVFIDTQTGIANQYMVRNGEMAPIESGVKIERPSLIIEAKMGTNNIEDTPFGALYNVRQQPGAYGIDPNMLGYNLFYSDPYGVGMSTNDIYRKVDISISIEINGKSDQEALLNIVDTNIKKLNGYLLPVEADYSIPNNMLLYIRNCIFKKEIDYIKSHKDILSKEELSEIQKNINSSFADVLLEYGYGDIRVYNRDDDEKFAISLNRKQQVYLEIGKFDTDEGSKKGNIYEYFKITSSGSFCFYNLVTFITKVPSIIRGTKNSNKMLMNNSKTNKNEYGVQTFRTTYHETRDLPRLPNNWYSLFLEKECLMEEEEESFNLMDFMHKQYIIDMRLKEILNIISEDQFRENFQLYIHKNNELLDPSLYTIDKDLNITISQCDKTVPYYIEIFTYSIWYNNMVEIFKK